MTEAQKNEALNQQFDNLIALWVLSVEQDIPDDSACIDAFEQWKISVEMAMKHKESSEAAQSMVEHCDMLLAVVQNFHHCAI